MLKLKEREEIIKGANFQKSCVGNEIQSVDGELNVTEDKGNPFFWELKNGVSVIRVKSK